LGFPHGGATTGHRAGKLLLPGEDELAAALLFMSKEKI